MSTLADRIRGVVGAANPASRLLDETPSGEGLRGAEHSRSGAAESRDLRPLGGDWCHAHGAPCFVVERRWPASARHGRERIGSLAERLEEGSSEAALFTSGVPAGPPFVFFDLETTGLSGGAGTLAFLVGCGFFDAEGAFVTRQFLLTQYADERPVLDAVAAELGRAGALVSFNGKSFDAPLLETRFMFHRMAWVGAGLPHVDVLHPARRFWKDRDPGLASCSLQTLERQIVGARRVGDVPGFEIPARYFQFVRSGNAGPLAPVFEHNRLDLLTLAALTARLLHLTRSGPADVSDAREVLALGCVYARAGLDERARGAFRLAIERCRSPRRAYDPIRIEALRLLALAWRRERRYEEAARCWSELLDIRGCPPQIGREANQALAVHHEHRDRDLERAHAFALRGLELDPQPSWTRAVHHRLARLERKLARPALMFNQPENSN